MFYFLEPIKWQTLKEEDKKCLNEQWQCGMMSGEPLTSGESQWGLRGDQESKTRYRESENTQLSSRELTW